MKFSELTDEEFMNFVNTSSEKNFFQTISMRNRIEKNNLATYLVGVKDNDKVIGASLICETNHKFLGKITYEAYKGFILDYHNKELVKFMSDEVVKFLKKKNGLRLIIDPYIVNVSRDGDGKVIDDIDNRNVTKYLLDMGYKTNNGEQVKWTYCLDLNKSIDDIFASFNSTTRNIIKQTLNKYKLVVRTLKRDELKEFKEITMDTCKRRGFPDKSLKYYEDMYDCFKNDVTFKICELHCDDYINSLEEENLLNEKKISELSGSRANEKKKKNILNDIGNNKKRIEEVKVLKAEKGNVIPLACAMFMLYGDEVVYLFSGSYKEYMKYYGQYRLQWEIIKYAKEHNYRRYNFYGIKNPLDIKDGDDGVYEFKKKFNGYVEELLGSFVIDVSFVNKIYDFLRKIKSIVK